MVSLDGRVALVTGASRGIGAAIARSLDGAGVRLGLASRSGDDLGLADVVAQPADVRDAAAQAAIVAASVERFARGPVRRAAAPSSTPGSAPTDRSSTCRPSTSTR